MRRLLLLLFLVPSIAAGQSTDAAKRPPMTWTVRIGQAGGFTGGGKGLRLTSDGKLSSESWVVPGADVHTEELGQLDKAELQGIEAQLQECHGGHGKLRGTMPRYVEVERDGQTTRGEGEDLPPAEDAVYQSITELVARKHGEALP